MINLTISIERKGTMIPVGTIIGSNDADAVFQYNKLYLNSNDSVPISISLPLQEAPFTTNQTSLFFEGLLPEGFTRRSVAQWLHVEEDNYISILHALGRECLGAIQVTQENELLDSSYELISQEHISKLAKEGTSKSTDLVIKSHLSLTGASGKVGLYYDDINDFWYLPFGTAASTHIVKQSHIRLDGIVTNEQLSMMTASSCGISIPESFIINTGNGSENAILFATRRYDRVFAEEPQIINGLPCPLRLHQEDFAQAMGIPAAQKYEKTGDGHMRKMFDLLRKYSSNPIEDQQKLWDMIVFNYLIGNTDAHIKNFSLLYGSDLKSIRLTPAYDIISTVVYEQSTRNMAFSIGDIHSIDDITTDSFRQAAKEIGLGENLAMKRFYDIYERFTPAITSNAEKLAAAGFKNAIEIKDRIMQKGGINKILSSK